MKTLPVNNVNFGSHAHGHYVTKCAKVLIPLTTLSAVGDLFVNREAQKPLADNLDDISDNFSQLVLNDDNSFENYYHIDLNMANSKTFRDSELFNPLLDDEQDFDYSKYSTDDLVSLEKNRAMNNNFYGYELCDTDIGDVELPELIKKPWNIENKEDDVFVSIKDKEILRSPEAKSILRPVSPNNFIASNLKKLFLKLINNKKTKDFSVEPQKIDSDVDDIMYTVNSRNEQIGLITYKLVMDLLNQNFSNTKISNHLKAYVENFKRGSLGLMKYYNSDNNSYDKRKIRKDGRFDLLEFIKNKKGH